MLVARTLSRIGAGFSGTMAALHLSRLMPERSVLLCEKSGAFARGVEATRREHAGRCRASPGGAVEGAVLEPAGEVIGLEHDEVVDLAPEGEGFCLTLAAGRRRHVAGAILARAANTPADVERVQAAPSRGQFSSQREK
jgi:glycine/D-amino acid oxidase-like deaminating enzyme